MMPPKTLTFPARADITPDPRVAQSGPSAAEMAVADLVLTEDPDALAGIARDAFPAEVSECGGVYRAFLEMTRERCAAHGIPYDERRFMEAFCRMLLDAAPELKR